MPTGTKVNVSGAVAKMKALGIAFDAKELLNAVGLVGLRWIDNNFRTEGALHPQGPWKKLSPNTIASRRGGSSRVLQDTGRTKQSYYKKVFGKRSVWVGSNEKTAEIHENGVGPFEIRPKGKKALRFMSKGGPRFAKVIRHPGLEARPMLPTKDIGKQLAIKVIEARIKQSGATK